MAIYSSIRIQASVGKNGKNSPVDVITVQTRLNELMRGPRKKLTEDGKIGSKTIGMIRDFQKCVLNYRRPDSRVDPNGKSHQALNDPASESKWARMSFVSEPDAPVQSATSADRDYRNLESMRGKDLAEALGHFEAWIGRNPLEIKRLVIRAGGWRWIVWKLEEKDEKKLGFPKWAHFVRQFFNEEPKSLNRVLDGDAERAIENALSSRALNSSEKNHVFAKLAYSGDVYNELARDKYGKLQWRKWIEQSQSGSMYHYKAGQRMGTIVHTAYSVVTPHNFTDVFKLCLNDGTGGSNEACFHNNDMSRSLGVAGKPIPAKEKAITSNKYRGSYNYADTMGIGYDLHEKFDVFTDNKWGSNYVNETQHSPISGRIFRREHFRV